VARSTKQNQMAPDLVAVVALEKSSIPLKNRQPDLNTAVNVALVVSLWVADIKAKTVASLR
jgi:hypothetical protein